MKRPVRVLVVDDSALMRQLLTVVLSSDPDIEVVGSAPDPLQAREMIKALNPDVVTLDVEMPHMDGVTFLRMIMKLRPMPVVMISTLTHAGAQTTLEALEIGAVDFVAKPTTNISSSMDAISAELCHKVKAASLARIQRVSLPVARPGAARPRADLQRDRLVFIGASTGGVEALKAVLMGLPENCPPTLITQHMPERFTKSFADRLNRECPMKVVEAQDRQIIEAGCVYIAPGSHHLEIARAAGQYCCSLSNGPLVSGHRPSVDVLFRSAARLVARNAVGVILTGMGKDGAQGLLEMRQAGAHTLGQDEASALIYGMPRVAFECGAVMRQHPLENIADAILAACRSDPATVGKTAAVRVGAA